MSIRRSTERDVATVRQVETGSVTIRADDAEAFLLGAALTPPCPRLADLVDLVAPDDFHNPRRARAWVGVRDCLAAGITPDSMTVGDAIARRGGKEDPTWLFDMSHNMPAVANADRYADAVISAAAARRLQVAAIAIHQLAETPDEIATMRENARQILDEACAGQHRTSARTLADVLPQVFDVAQHGTVSALPTPWPDIDRLTGGLAPGRLIVVGARPGVGKSLLGTNLALHVAGHQSHAVLFASLEMPELEVGQRLVAARSSVNLSRLQAGRTHDDEFSRIAEIEAALLDLPITIDDSASQTVASIRAKARDIQRKRDDLALIVVDYLQLVAPASRSGNRAEDVGTISRELKILARETGACVVAMAQVNREGARHGDGRPKMSDLRESGSIEADADQVLLLHQPDDNVPELEVAVDKNRHGPRGVARLQVAGHYAQLNPITWTPTSVLRDAPRGVA